MHRRDLIKASLLGAAALVVRPRFAMAGETEAIAGELATLERQHGGRLGVAMLDIGSGRHAGHRAGERFLLCSTGKLLVVGAVLARVDRGEEQLSRRIVFGPDVILEWAPVTRKHVGAPGMTVAELCHAALTISDNTAMNLLLKSVGGPAAATRFVRSLDDDITRLDRHEPELNVPDRNLDTTTPDAMLASLRKLLLGNVLSASSRAQLIDWLRHNTTGETQLRAGMPASWQAGDKTGSGHTQTNDVAIAWPPGRQPLLVTAYYEGPADQGDMRKAVLAHVGKLAARME
ncbi:class A beta-lactamase [Rhodanobacter glycinis]|uniref:Beta-lactamase n=1 Tax=Rhodanobacter glycinis TaxID=582702 RepID=A0A1I3Z3F5_9GAMM|nr:class A beta-lactamase [Rhodanobacter glycinis]SFK38530.1 beta-lactamase class A [Rhodanobacter glycinis]